MKQSNKIQSRKTIPAPVSEGDGTGNFPLKWHNFLSHFALWCYALVCSACAITSLTSINNLEFQSKLFPKTISNYFVPGRTTAVLLYNNFALILIAIFSIVTAILLIKRKKPAVKALLSLFIIDCAHDILFPIFLWYTGNSGTVVRQKSDFPVFLILQLLLGNAIIILFTHHYYKKRSSLFA